MSSLAAQLAGIRANNNATVLDKSKRKKIHSISLVYEPKDAASQDFETIYYDCLEAFRELVEIDSRFDLFTNSLFSETSIRFDRRVQNKDQGDALNSAIDQFFMLVANYLHLQPALRAMEWLVRRFQIQIHNTESLLLALLPWHDHQVFVRILDIIVAPAQFPQIFQFLTVSQKNLQGPSKSSLLRVFLRDSTLFQAFNGWSITTMQHGYSYNRELVFWSSVNTLIAFAYKEQGDAFEATDKLLPLVSEVITMKSQPQAQVAGYLILSVTVSQFRLSRDILEAALRAVVMHWSASSCTKGLRCIAQIVAALSMELSEVYIFDHDTFDAIVNVFGASLSTLKDEILLFADSAEKLSASVVLSCLQYSPAEYESVSELAVSPSVAHLVKEPVLEFIVHNAPFDEALTNAFAHFISSVEGLSAIQIDRLEIALQVSLQRDDQTTKANTTVTEEAVPGGYIRSDDLNKIMDAAENLEQSTQRTFLETPLPTSNKRAQIWSQLASSGGTVDLDQLRQLARVAPEAQLSFMLAIAIGPWPTVTRIAALRVATAMVRSVIESNPSSADYQSMLPLILFLLSDPEPRIRHEGVKLLQVVSLEKPGSRCPRWLVSGSSDHLSWLSKHDLANVFKKLMENAAECELDASHVFTAARQAGKASWCEFLMRHAQTTRLPQMLWVTLKCLANFKGVTKQLAPNLLSQWNTNAVRQQWKQLCRDAKFPLSAVEKALIGVVRSNEHTGIQLLLDLLRTRDDSPAITEAVSEHVLTIWNSGDHPLKPETKVYIVESLVEIVVDETVRFDPTSLLTQLPLDTNMFVTLLEDSAPTSLASGGGDSTMDSEKPLFNETSKRRRRRSSSTLQLRNGPHHEVQAAAERHLKRTTLILELLEPRTTQLENPVPLVNILFDTLERLIALGEGSARLPVLYTEELLANCMIQLVESLKSSHQDLRDLSSVKVNVVVSCIRTSTSPQVQNRLLLLVASLATVCPDAVLHGVMPIFTFMGANTVRLDNDFSAHVIQQTIEQVIPALVAAGDKHEEIEMALMSFVAAFPHVPRHRRNTLFGALIKTLGPQQSLYKLLLLLAQRYSEALTAPTRRSADAKSLVHFATPFLRSFDAADQLRAMNSFVKFVADEPEMPAKFGLLKIKENLSKSSHLQNMFYEFLVRTIGDSENIPGTQPLRVQVSHSQLSEEEWKLATSMVSVLLGNTNSPAAELLLVQVLGILPIDRFVFVVIPLITSENSKVLDLIVQKFRYEPSDDVAALQSAQQVMGKLLQLISQDLSTSMVIDTAEALIAKFGNHMREQGLQLLGALIGPYGLQNTDDDEKVVSACLAINSVCQHMGAATYRFFPQFFPALQTQMKTTKNPDVELAGFALMAGLIRQMPRFMEPETPVILDLVLSSHIAVSARMQLVKVLDEKMSPRTLLKALTHAWPSASQGGLSGVDILFVALGNTHEKISPRELASEISHVTELLIQCFSVREQLSDLQETPDYNFINQVESRAIEWGVASVLKLNDRVFRPQFKRIVEWGFGASSTGVLTTSPYRQIAVLKFVNRVFTQLKGVVTNYYGYIFDDFARILEVPTSTPTEATVKKLLLQSLIASITNDQDDFWQAPARFEKLSQLLVSQLSAQPMTHGPLLVKSLVSLATSSSPQNRKRMNDDLSQLLVAGASSSQKVWTIKVFSGLYRRIGEDWVANLPQLVPLIAELLDDEDENVENETRKSLVPVIENVLGESLDRYLA